MRKIAITTLAVLAMGSMEAQAADYGIGVSVQSNDAIIYAPVDFNDKFRVEPNIRYRKDTVGNDFGPDTKLERLEVGVGLFGLSAVNKSVRLYYGGRLAYVKQKMTTPVIVPSNNFFSNRASSISDAVISVTTDTDGFRVAPTVGFEFLFNERLSLGGEAAYFYQKLNGDVDSKSNGTDTRLILRFKF